MDAPNNVNCGLPVPSRAKVEGKCAVGGGLVEFVLPEWRSCLILLLFIGIRARAGVVVLAVKLEF